MLDRLDVARVLACLAISCVACASSLGSSATPVEPARAPIPNEPTSAAQSRLARAYGELPLHFEVNQGQTNPDVSFLARGPNYRIFLTPSAAVITLSEHRPVARDTGARATHDAALRIRFEGANPNTRVSGETPLGGNSNYFIGNDPKKHLTDIAHYAQVRYSQIYPNIDLLYYGNQGQLEYDFVLAPGADPAHIRLAIEGADRVSIDASGDLLLSTAMGDIKQHRPLVYQESGTTRRPIDARYVRNSDATIGIHVASYDPSLPLVIDPVLSYATFIGGLSDDFGTAIAVDASGNAYVTGYTYSTNFPVLGAYQKSPGRNAVTNVFVTKLNASGSAIVYSTYLGGGSETDYATGIAVDASGNAYVTGTTTGSSFPTTTGAYQKGATGGGSFVAKLGASGNTLAYSTYVLKASAKAIALDSNGSAYLTGSATTGFTTTTGAYQTASRSSAGTNAFVLKLNATGTAASYSTFLGGGANDVGQGIAIDSASNVYVGGSTTSSNFPVVNAVQSARRGPSDGFVTKLNAAGNALIYSTYLGGEDNDAIYALAVDQSGSAYVGGQTYSFDFPTRPFAFQEDKPSYSSQTNEGNGFVVKLAPSGDALVYSTYLGGNLCGYYSCSLFNPPPEVPVDAVYGIAVDSTGHAYVTGLTYSLQFPLVDSLVPQFPPWGNGLFVAKLSQAGNALLYSTFIKTGPKSYDTNSATPAGFPYGAGKGIAVDGSGNAYGVGEAGTEFTATTGAFKTVNAGGSDAIAFKLASTWGSMSLTTASSTITTNQPFQITAAVPGGGSTGIVTIQYYRTTSSGAGTLANIPLVNGTATYSASGFAAGVYFFSATYRNANANVADSPLLTLIVNPSAVCN